MNVFFRLRGLPGCGKSTEAKRIGKILTACDIDWVRVNRDSMRQEMFGYEAPGKDTGRREGMVSTVQNELYRLAALKNWYIISDNVNGPHNQDVLFCRQNGYTMVDVWFTATVEECVVRANARERQVHASVIQDMAARYPWLDVSQPKTLTMAGAPVIVSLVEGFDVLQLIKGQ